MRRVVVAMCAVLCAACTGASPEGVPPATSTAPSGPVSTSTPPVPDPVPTASAPAPADPDDVHTATAMRAVRHLAGGIGPRPGTSRAFHEAAAWVVDELRRSGWDVQQQSFQVPGGASVAGPTEGLPVEGGRSLNVIASRGDLVAGEPWLLVGAHLDTVPTSPGAEDNASGIGALLAVAEAVADRETRLPVALVAFGAEEPRGRTDEDHHYGSTAYVASLTAAERRSLRGMIAMDRVGVGSVIPVGSVEDGDPLRAEVLAVADRLGIPTAPEAGQRSSDHWSFVQEGMPGIRLGSTPYAGYHSPGDVVGVVEPDQVTRAARIVVAWLS